MTKGSSTHISELLKKVEAIKSRDLLKKVSETDRLEARDKEDDYHVNRNFKTIKKFLLWCVAVIGALCGTFITGLVMWALYIYFDNTLRDPVETENLIKNGLFTVLVAGATLFIENIFRHKYKKQ